MNKCIPIPKSDFIFKKKIHFNWNMKKVKLLPSPNKYVATPRGKIGARARSP